MGAAKIYTVYNLKNEQLFKGSSLEVVKAGYVHHVEMVYKMSKRAAATRDGYIIKAEEIPKEPLEPICCVCGKTFKGSLSAAYCPACRKNRKGCHKQRTKAAKYTPNDELGEAMHDCIKWCEKNNKPSYSYGAWVMAGRPTW